MHKKSIYTICRCGLFAAIICLISPFTLPIGPVPVSLSLTAVMTTGILLSKGEAVTTVFVYILIGLLGLPVFAGACGGAQVLFGVTGGYIWSYPFVALITSAFSKIKKGKLNYIFSFSGCITATVISYVFGTIQYMFITHNNISQALIICVLPFIVVDILKSLAAVLIAIPLSKRIR